MASGLSPKLPLRRDNVDGFKLNKSIEELARQNMKMLLLTSPGERVGIPSYGVGLKRFLFEPLTEGVLASIRSKIRTQMSKYLPAISIDNILFDSALNNPVLASSDPHLLRISINYTVIPTNTKSSIVLDALDSVIREAPSTQSLRTY